MKVLILAGSPRKNGNSYKLAAAFQSGLNGYEVTVVPVGNLKINGCLACEYCHTKGNGQCIQQDDMQKVYPLLAEADAIVIASPVHYWGLSGQLQSLMTRLYAPHKPAKARKYALLLASSSEGVYDGIEFQFRECIPYIGGELVGIVKTSMEAGNLEEACEKARELAAKF